MCLRNFFYSFQDNDLKLAAKAGHVHKGYKTVIKLLLIELCTLDVFRKLPYTHGKTIPTVFKLMV